MALHGGHPGTVGNATEGDFLATAIGGTPIQA